MTRAAALYLAAFLYVRYPRVFAGLDWMATR
jgi:hypothetical protein